MTNARDVLFNPLLNDNPITLQILGICSALAITNSLASALIMSAAVTSVLAVSNVAISLLRHHLPSSVRLIVQMTVIASSVIVIDEVLKAYAPRMSETLSVFVSLIITNCIVLARSEAFAMRHGVGMSLLDGIGNGIGYSLILVAVAVVRELFGTGGLMGYQFFTLVEDGGWFQPNRMMLLAPSAFFIIGFMIWGIRRWRTEQVEQPDFEEAPTPLGHPEAA